MSRVLAHGAIAVAVGAALVIRAWGTSSSTSIVDEKPAVSVPPKTCGKKVKTAIRLTLKDYQLAYLQTIVSVRLLLYFSWKLDHLGSLLQERDGSIKDVSHALRILFRFASSPRANLVRTPPTAADVFFRLL